MSAQNLEPVTPDPKKLRRTAFLLVIIMIVGGIVILKAYEKRAKEGNKDDRPSLLTKISETKDLTYLQQNGEISELMSLKGKVIVVQCVPQSQPDETTGEIMKRLSKKYSDHEDFALVTLVLDPGPADGLRDQLQDVAESLGAELPQWTVASNQRESLHKFIKNEFKANMLPYETDGVWRYDQSLVLLDKERHVRRAVVPQKRGGSPYVATFDFEQAKKWDSEGVKTGTDLSNTEQLEVLLEDTIEILLNEETKP